MSEVNSHGANKFESAASPCHGLDDALGGEDRGEKGQDDGCKLTPGDE